MEKDTEITEKDGNVTGKDPVTGQFVAGNKLGGKTAGTLDFKTKWINFIEKVAAQNDMTPNEIDEQLLAVAFKKAKDGDYAFYRDTQDRVHGKPLQVTELTGLGGKDLFNGETKDKADKLVKEYLGNTESNSD